VALHAVGLVGTPYRYGGNSPDAGFDCSGLIGYVYWHAANTRAPRTVAQIVQWGQPVMRQALRTGDLVVFTARGQPNHAGIYVGDGRFVHAPSSGGTVRLEALSARHWMSMDVSYRRP
jgi:cell wall-associated NlpC family hydrolase